MLPTGLVVLLSFAAAISAAMEKILPFVVLTIWRIGSSLGKMSTVVGIGGEN